MKEQLFNLQIPITKKLESELRECAKRDDRKLRTHCRRILENYVVECKANGIIEENPIEKNIPTPPHISQCKIETTSFALRKVTISLDFGYSYAKGSTYRDKKLVLAKLPNKIQSNKTINQKARKFKRNGAVLYMGVGELNNNVLKHTRHSLLEQTLVMISELYPNDLSLKVDLKLGLPPIQLFNDAYLEAYKFKFPIDEEIKFSVDGVDRSVVFSSVEVCAEGYSGFLAILDNIDTKQEVLSIDVGGGTTDIGNYQYDYEDGQYYPNEIDTIQKGVIDLATDVASYFNNKEGADVTVAQIDHVFKNDLEVIEYQGKEYPLENYLPALKPLIDTMLNTITNKFGQLDRYVVVGLGGGYKIFHRMIKDQISKEILLDSDTQFYANVIGFLEQ